MINTLIQRCDLYQNNPIIYNEIIVNFIKEVFKIINSHTINNII